MKYIAFLENDLQAFLDDTTEFVKCANSKLEEKEKKCSDLVFRSRLQM